MGVKMRFNLILSLLLMLFLSNFILTNKVQAQYLVSPATQTIGFVNILDVVARYEKAQRIDKQLKQSEEEFKKLYEEKQKELESYAQQETSLTKLKDYKAKLESELEPKLDKLIQQSDKVSAEILKEIVEAIKVVADRKKIDIVLRSEVILAGGIDMTDWVVNELNAKNK